MPLGLATPYQTRPQPTRGISTAQQVGTYGRRAPIQRGFDDPGYAPPTQSPFPGRPVGGPPVPAANALTYNLPAQFDIAEGYYGALANIDTAAIQQQQEILNQLMAAQDPGQIKDLLTQLTLMQSQANAQQTFQNQEQFGYQQAQQQQLANYLQQQLGFGQQGLGLDLQQIEQQRINQLQAAGLSKDQAQAQFAAELASGKLSFETGMATATQQRQYGLGQTLQERDISRRRTREEAAARGATGTLGYGLDWEDISQTYERESQNIQKTFEIRQTYETQTWKNLQNKIAAGQKLTDQEYNMLVSQANAEAELQQSAANLGWQQTQAQLGYQQGVLGSQQQAALSQYNYEQQKIALQDQMRDIQWQMQMAQMSNPSAVLGLQQQYSALQSQLAQIPLQTASNILGAVQQGLPAPWAPVAPAWQGTLTSSTATGGPRPITYR